MKKKMYIFIAIISMFLLNIDVAFADHCASCTSDDCISCGNDCIPDGSTCKKVTYDNYDSKLFACGHDSSKPISTTNRPLLDGVPTYASKIVHFAYTLFQIAVPIVLVIFGIIDLIKGITSSKEDEIKKGQKTLIKRAVYAIIIFFVFALVKVFVSLVADANGAKIVKCVECFIEDNCY